MACRASGSSAPDTRISVNVVAKASEAGFDEENLGECRFVKLWGKYGWAD